MNKCMEKLSIPDILGAFLLLLWLEEQKRELSVKQQFWTWVIHWATD